MSKRDTPKPILNPSVSFFSGTQPVPAVNVANQAVASTSGQAVVTPIGPIVNPAAVFASETFTNPVAAVEAVVVDVDR